MKDYSKPTTVLWKQLRTHVDVWCHITQEVKMSQWRQVPVRSERASGFRFLALGMRCPALNVWWVTWLLHTRKHTLGKIFVLKRLPTARRTQLKTAAPREKDGATLHTQGVENLGPPGSEGRRQHMSYRDTNNRSIPGTWPSGNLPKVNALGFQFLWRSEMTPNSSSHPHF